MESKKDAFKRRLRSSTKSSSSSPAEKCVKTSSEPPEEPIKLPKSFVFTACTGQSLSAFVVHSSEFARMGTGQLPRIVDKLTTFSSRNSPKLLAAFLQLQTAPLCFVSSEEWLEGIIKVQETSVKTLMQNASYLPMKSSTKSTKTESVCQNYLRTFVKSRMYKDVHLQKSLRPFPQKTAAERKVTTNDEAETKTVLIKTITTNQGPKSDDEKPEQKEDIKTLLFLDLETTGLRPCKISEICLCAVKVTADHKLSGDVDKLLLVVDPIKKIGGTAARMTQLDNAAIEGSEKLGTRDERVQSVLGEFLRAQTAPLCFVAHNGVRFDFPIFRDEFCRKKGENMSPSLQSAHCVDSISALHQILRRKSFSLSSFISEYSNDDGDHHTAEFDTEMLVTISRRHPQVLKCYNTLKGKLVY